ncbi:MAG: hypothetical protein ACRDCB_09005 [Clostridium sp.]
MVYNIYNEISKQLLLDDCESALSLIDYVKYKDYEVVFYMQMMPYFSYLCNSILKFYDFKNKDKINIKDKNVATIISNMRLKLKLYSERKTKPLQSTKTLERIHLDFYDFFLKKYLNYNYFLKLLGIVELNDFGTYKIQDKYIGNIYLNQWYLNELFDINEIGSMESKDNILLFSSELAHILKRICQDENILTQNLYENDNIVIEEYNFLLFNTPTKIFNDKYDKYSSLLLFNILCSINFTLYFLDKILPKENQFYFRIKFSCYYSSISSLRLLINQVNCNNEIKTGVENYIKQIEDIENFKYSFGEPSKLRNCILHYKIREEDIPKEDILYNTPFYGLIEKYTKKDYFSFSKELDKNLRELSLILENWILNY